MAISKLCSRCQTVIPYTEKLCDDCKAKVGSHRKISDKLYSESRADKEFQKIYRSPRWKSVRRLAIVRANGLCEQCMHKGKISYYEDVHHKTPIKVDIRRAYDIDNLICLCRSCHIEAHKRIDKETSNKSNGQMGRGYQKSF